MALTFTDLISEWNRASGAAESSAGVSVVEGINQALDYVSSMHEWRGLVRSAVDLATVANQSYIDLPVDCAKIITIQYSDGNWRAIRFVTQEQLAVWKTTNQPAPGYSGTYIGATSWAEGATGATPRLDVYPDISETNSDTFRITYRSRLLLTAVGSAADTTVLQLPPYMNWLVRAVVRIFAKGVEEEDDGTVWARIEELERSAALFRTKTADGSMQPSIGRMKGGAAQFGSLRIADTDEELADPA